MNKVKIIEGNHDEMVMISEFLIKQGFTPVYGLEASNWKDDPFGMHDEGRGWRSFKGDLIWRCREPIPRFVIENHFDLPKAIRICHFPDSPEVGVSFISDATSDTELITSDSLQNKLGDKNANFDLGITE